MQLNLLVSVTVLNFLSPADGLLIIMRVLVGCRVLPHVGGNGEE
jgi:hypothetical protein